MTHFAYRDGELHAEQVALQRIAADVGTPFYCYSTAMIEQQYRDFAGAFAGQPARVYYALKANANLSVVSILARLGAGADVVSEGELRRALQAGVAPGNIVFSGVGKTASELRFGLEAGIYQFNVELASELDVLSGIATQLGRRAPITLRINPDVDAKTHAHISTGKAENKFGVPWIEARALYAHAAASPNLEPLGLSVHIGSQIFDLAALEQAFLRLRELIQMLRADGHEVRRFDLGGGLGIRYRDEAPLSLGDYAAMIGRVTGNLGCELALEPGRLLVGNAGVLVSRVLYIKRAGRKTFVVLDCAMNDLARPSLYDAWHEVVPLSEPTKGVPYAPVDLVGPICESTDKLAADRPMPPLAEGDPVAILSAGAYGATMASTYNLRLLIPEVMVNGNRFAIVRPRQTYAELLGNDLLPAWLAGGAAT